MTALFSEGDIEIINRLRFDPGVPVGMSLTGHVYWLDEMPIPQIHMLRDFAAYQDVIYSRQVLYFATEFQELGRGNRKFAATVFDMARQEIPNWIGFKRLSLSARDKAIIGDCLAKAIE